LLPPALRNGALSKASHDWEEVFARGWEPGESDEALRGRWAEARRLADGDPARALAIHVELAEAGSPFSMLMAGAYYERGRGTARDAAVAEDFYRRALCAGSWKATVRYARLLFERGAHDAWPSTLGDGVANGFIPSFFWLAWYSYKRSPSARTAREVRHLLETAADAGHPDAGLVLARWAASGKFGWREIRDGHRKLLLAVRSANERASGMAFAAGPAFAGDDEGRPDS
jgi:TPR repeat protein